MSSAVISPDGAYRYVLRRDIPQVVRWVRPCLFIMLNPSIADAELDDPTIRRCRGFARSLGCTSLTVVNLFALRSTDPDALIGCLVDPYGPDNDQHIINELADHRLGICVAAWGAHPATQRYCRTISLLRTMKAELYCLGKTKDGSPRHPLYVKGNQGLVSWP